MLKELESCKIHKVSKLFDIWHFGQGHSILSGENSFFKIYDHDSIDLVCDRDIKFLNKMYDEEKREDQGTDE